MGEDLSLASEITVGPFTGETLPPEGRENYTFVPENLDFFADSAKTFFPGISAAHLRFHQTASMAYTDGQIEYQMGSDKKHPNFLNLHGMNSPALTMSYFIGLDVARRYLLGKWDNFLR